MDYLTNFYKNKCDQLQEQVNKLSSEIKFLNEMESPEASDSSQRNIVPPGSIPPPKMPPPTRLDPGSLPPGHIRPNGQGTIGDIDWEKIDEEMQGIINLFRQLMELMRTLSWDQFVEYMRRVHGITNLSDEWDLQDWFRDYYINKMKQVFRNQYPNATGEQWRTFLEKLIEQLNEGLWDVFDGDTYNFPSDVPDNETPQEGPSERDRERARERWERQNY
jgi:hypothetical protein